MKEYRKIATVKAKLFEPGDEDGFALAEDFHNVLDDVKYGIKPDVLPYVKTLENQYHKGQFWEHYICVGIKGERWLVEKDIFEKTYQEV